MIPAIVYGQVNLMILKHSSINQTGEVFPWEGASDQEVRLVGGYLAEWQCP